MDRVLPTRRPITAAFAGILAVIATLVAAVPPAQAVHPIEVRVGGGSDTECADDGSDNVMEFSVSLHNPNGTQTTPDPGSTVEVSFETIAVPAPEKELATEGEDYTFASGTLEMTFGDTGATAEVPLTCDDVAEGEESFTVVFFDLEGASFEEGGSDQRVTGLIQDGGTAPPGPRFFITDATPPTVTEGGDDDDVSVTFTVRLDDTSSCGMPIPCTINYATVEGTAKEDSDYEETSDTFTWPDVENGNDNERTVTVPIVGNSSAEPTEEFTVELSDPNGGTITDGSGLAVIADDDASRVSVRDAASSEDDGTHAVPFVINQPVDTPVYVVWETIEGSAKDGTDFTSKRAVTQIPAGADGADGSVALVDNDTVEAFEERFYVQVDCLESDSNTTCDNAVDSAVAALGDTFGRQTIQDDEPTVNVANASGPEGDEISFDVTLSEPRPDRDVIVTVETADGTATAGEDYEATEATLTFEVGETTPTEGPVTVATIEDEATEGNETFTLVPTEADAAALGTSGTGTIVDDEDPNNPEVTADAGDDRSADSYEVVSFDGDFSGGTPPVSYKWNFGDGSPEAEGEKVTHRYTSDGTFTAVLTVTDDTGKTDTDEVEVTVVDTGVVLRSSGTDRIRTAVDVSNDHWEAATDVLMATAYNFPDGLAAGALASELDAPLLLTETDTLRDDVAAELNRLGADRVVLLGGTGAISEDVEDELVARGYEVDRVAKATRFGTAADIARLVGATPKGEVLLTLGESPDGVQVAWADALSAGSFSALAEVPPTLLTRRDALPEETEQALADLEAEKVYIIGGTGAVSNNVQQQLRNLGYDVERLAGTGRYHTSAVVAAKALTMYPAGQVHPVFATGDKYPDGLTGGALAGQVTGPVLLVPGNLDHAPEVRDLIMEHAQRFDDGTAVGGPTVVAESTRQQAERAMRA